MSLARILPDPGEKGVAVKKEDSGGAGRKAAEGREGKIAAVMQPLTLL
jgi:hypothetical protein